MANSKSKQFLNLLLVLILFLAPFEVLFASSHTMHDTDLSEAVEQAMEVHTDHFVSMPNMVDNNTYSFDQNCEKQCANCVFCTAVMFSEVNSHEDLITTFASSYHYAHINNITDVDIRPPK